jgi:Tol biopolymer transport system component/tRNA A-37 threonylcarbamoyl transferase component Bud32
MRCSSWVAQPLILCAMSDQFERFTQALADRYRVEEQVGAGGMATVYRAEDVKHRRKVALKVLRPELAAMLGVERFLREIEIAAQLQHPHILPLHDSGEADGQLYYVMPYVDGESLRDRLRREQQFSIEDTLHLAGEIADGLGYAHSKGVVHRDIKPENIMLSGGHALITDFGIARAVREAGGERLTETGLSLGTPEYMSPEQATGAPHIDARSDVYALGCVVYEMLVGEPPHTGPNPQAIMAKVLTQPVPSIREARETVPLGMDGTVARALAKLPADRFATAREFGDALQESLATGGMQAIRPRSAAPAWLWPAIATAAVATLVAVLLWAPWRNRESGAAAAGVFHLSMKINPLAVTAHAPASAVVLSPDGSQVAYVTGEGGVGQVYLRRLDGQVATPVPGASNAQAPFFSPDGQWLGFVSDGRLRKVSLADGTPFTICDALEMHGADWNPDGRIVIGANAGNGWGLSLVDSDGGQPTLLRGPDEVESAVYLLYPSWLPGENAVLFTASGGSGNSVNISVLDVATGEHHVVVEGGGAARYVSTGHVVYSRDGAIFAVPFDVDRYTVTGQPVRVVDDALMGFPFEPALAHFDIAPNGTFVYLSSSGGEYVGEQLAWVTRDGEVDVIEGLFEGGGDPATPWGPRVSPDGSRILFWSPSLEWPTNDIGQSGNVWLYDISRDALSKLTLDRPDFFWSVWMPDGERIVSIGGEPRSMAASLYSMRADGVGEMTRLTTAHDAQWQQPVSVTADGEWLLYQQSDAGTGFDIWALPMKSGDPPRVVLDGPEETAYPAISPNGRWLAYAVLGLQGDEVFVTDFPAVRGRWQVSTNGTAPLWSPDGRELYFQQQTPEGRLAVFAVQVADAPTFTEGRPTKLFEGPFVGSLPFGVSYDIAPDGERFLMMRQPTGGEVLTNLSVVVNWFAELRQRMEDD